MSTYSTLEVNRIPLYIPRRKTEWESFLKAHDLKPSEAKAVAGLYDPDGKLRGCASLCVCGTGLSIQCVAMDESAGEHGQVGRLIDFLRNIALEESESGIMPDLFLFTKPEYEQLFSSLAFHTVGRAPKAVLLESDRMALKRYVRYLEQHRCPGKNGVVVMNANPFTKGHLYLLRQAARQVDILYVIPVLDDGGNNGKLHYPYGLRRRAIEASANLLPNVTVLEGSRYAISAATFPNYFIKTLTEVTDNQIALDLDIFARHIAPALGVSVRFVGSEPTDVLTARYNELLHSILPAKGIEVVEIPRITEGKLDEKSLSDKNEVISASRVRGYVQEHHWHQVAAIVPPQTMAVLLGDLAVKSLMAELDADPKPGLVTPTSSGAHTDMDYNIMQRAISALRPAFEELAMLGIDNGTHRQIQEAGIRAEEAMMEASGGVNTHRGAIFSLGLTIVAAARLLGNGEPVTEGNLRREITLLAAPFKSPEESHGAEVRRRNKLRSALEMAQEGYSELFDCWLPFYRDAQKRPMPLQATLLYIMSTLDDTNICHRGGAEALQHVKRRSKEVLESFTEESLKAFSGEMTVRNLSPGGSADMLALTILSDSLIEQ